MVKIAKLNLSELNKILRNVNARWEAAEPAAEYALGFSPGPDDYSLEELENLAYANHRRFMAAAAVAAPLYPSSVDWRQFPDQAPLPGGNYVTPVRYQGEHCGSCVAFGTLAALESAIRIHARDPNQVVDLSEADLFYCHAAAQGRRCTGLLTGWWWPGAALAVCENPGVVDETCFPYTPGDQPCNRCNDWQSGLTKISHWHRIISTVEMKQWLSAKGPLITVFIVYDDFVHYKSGIYHHVSGGFAGGHCVCCVGYDDVRRCWICKNSWGTNWGESGFFNIAYGEVGIGAIMWALEI